MDKTLIVFACLLGFAFAQFGSQTGAFSRFNNQQRQQQPPQRSQFQQQPQQQQQRQPQPQAAQNYGGCNELNERQPVPGSCDRYIECINGTAEEKLCPDGLRFNPNVNFNVYPCQYPNEVACLERSALQPAQPTEQCPNQFGYFKLGDERNCSYFRNCVNGVGYDITCPEGLAFNSATYRCEWPDEVEDCDAEAFLGFRCPEIPQSRELGPPAGFRFYRAEDNCQKYFICIDQRPRVLYCGSDAAFDDLTSSCVSADEVEACPQELRIRAAQAREEQQQRIAKEIEFNSKPHNKSKRRY